MGSNSQPVVMFLAPGQWAGHMRIYHRECITLAEAGYRVELVAHPLAGESLDPRICLHSLSDYKEPNYDLRLAQRFYRCKQAYNLARASNARAFQYCSPEFILWGAQLRKATRMPVLFDCMEDFEGYVLQRPRIPDITRGPISRLVRWQLQFAAHSCDAIIVSNESTAEFFRPYARSLLILHNYPRFALFPDSKYPLPHEEYDIVYHGGISKDFIESCLHIDDALKERGYRVKWRFIGGMPYGDWLAKQLRSRGVEERFYISGRIPHERIAEEVRKAKIGIIPLPDLPMYQSNIPQKLFEFMALRIPIVMSDLPPTRAFIGDGGCAIIVPPNNYDAYADAIIRLLDNQLLRIRMGAEGRRRFENKYNWENESEKLRDVYAKLFKDNI